MVVGSSKNLYFFFSSFVNLKTSIKNIGLLYSIIASLSVEVIKYPGDTTVLLTIPSKSDDKNSKLFFSTRINFTAITHDLCSLGINLIQLVLDKSHKDKNPL